MKKIIVLYCLFFFFSGFSQTKSKIAVDDNISSSIKITVNSIEEFNKVNWRLFKDVFNDAKPNDIIAFIIEVYLPNSKNKLHYFLKAKGKVKDRKKIVQRLEKITKRLQNKLKKSQKNEK